MDSVRTSIDILQGDSEVAPDPSWAPRARLSRTLVNRLLEARESSDARESAGKDTSTGPLLDGFALCVEFEKTVEDQELWQSSFGNGRSEESLDERRKRDAENRQRGKDVLVVWPEVVVSPAIHPSAGRVKSWTYRSYSQESSVTDKSDEETLSIPQSTLENHPSLAHLLDDFEASAADIYANVSLVRPPVLTKVILHQVPTESPRAHSSTDEGQEARDVLKELGGEEAGSSPVIVRQDTHWTSSRTGKTYAVLLAIPFTQGVISPSTTEVIISSPETSSPTTHQNGTTEESPSTSSLVDRLALSSSLQHKNLLFGGMARSTASRSTRQQRAMLNFSTDGFLSASLVVDPSRERREAGRQRKVEMRGLMAGKGIDELQEEDEDDEDDDDPFWDDELDDDQPSSDEDGNDTDILLGTGPSSSSSLGSSLSESSGSITPRPHSYLDTDQPFLHTVSADGDPPTQLDTRADRPASNGFANGHPGQMDGMNGAEHDTKQTDEQDMFRGFAFEPFPVRRRPLSASTRFREMTAAASGKGKGKEERGGSGDDSGEGTRWPDDEAVVWLSLKGLARAGVFVGDWVRICCASGFLEVTDGVFSR